MFGGLISNSTIWYMLFESIFGILCDEVFNKEAFNSNPFVFENAGNSIVLTANFGAMNDPAAILLLNFMIATISVGSSGSCDQLFWLQLKQYTTVIHNIVNKVYLKYLMFNKSLDFIVGF